MPRRTRWADSDTMQLAQLAVEGLGNHYGNISEAAAQNGFGKATFHRIKKGVGVSLGTAQRVIALHDRIVAAAPNELANDNRPAKQPAKQPSSTPARSVTNALSHTVDAAKHLRAAERELLAASASTSPIAREGYKALAKRVRDMHDEYLAPLIP